MSSTNPGSLPASFFDPSGTLSEPPKDPGPTSLWSGPCTHRTLLRAAVAKEAASCMPGVSTHPEALHYPMSLDDDYLAVSPPAAGYLLASVTDPVLPGMTRDGLRAHRMGLAITRHLFSRPWLYDLVHPVRLTAHPDLLDCAVRLGGLGKDDFHRAKDALLRSFLGALRRDLCAKAPRVPTPRSSGGLQELILAGYGRVPEMLADKSRTGVTLWAYGGPALRKVLPDLRAVDTSGPLTVCELTLWTLGGADHVVRVFVDQEADERAVLGWTDHRGSNLSAVRWPIVGPAIVVPTTNPVGYLADLQQFAQFDARPDCLVSVKL